MQPQPFVIGMFARYTGGYYFDAILNPARPTESSATSLRTKIGTLSQPV
jgi:hypothetical protein